jgi:hypothetical protein
LYVLNVATVSVSQSFTLFVPEAPDAVGGHGFRNLIFDAGASMAAKFVVNGYPTPMAALPAGAPGKPMTIKMTGGVLPPGLSLVTANASGIPLGYATIQGSASAASVGSVFPIELTLDNGIGTRILNWQISDCSDYNKVKAALGVKFGDGTFNQALDLNGDQIIDALDLSIVQNAVAGGCK